MYCSQFQIFDFLTALEANAVSEHDFYEALATFLELRGLVFLESDCFTIDH